VALRAPELAPPRRDQDGLDLGASAELLDRGGDLGADVGRSDVKPARDRERGQAERREPEHAPLTVAERTIRCQAEPPGA
jgi:hypothetical protein